MSKRIMHTITMLALPMLGALAVQSDVALAKPQSPWRPTPVASAPDPSETVKNAPASAWRDVDPENLLIVELQDGARMAIELAPQFAPVHVANIRAFARSQWWSKAAIYRLQDNYVVQWGIDFPETWAQQNPSPLPPGVIEVPAAEYDRALAGLTIRPLGYPDSYAPGVGHADSWPVGYDPKTKRAWLTHCYGMVGVARALAPDTGSGSELYAILGHAPRHLDLNIALVGRVLEGFERFTAFHRGTEALGIYKDPAERVPIARISVAADLPAAERPAYEVMRSDSEAFAAYVLGRANRTGPFFKRPTGGVDLCNAPVPVRRKQGS